MPATLARTARPAQTAGCRRTPVDDDVPGAEALFDTVDRAALTALVREAARSATLEIDDWRAEAIRRGMGAATGAVYRVAGAGRGFPARVGGGTLRVQHRPDSARRDVDGPGGARDVPHPGRRPPAPAVGGARGVLRRPRPAAADALPPRRVAPESL